MLLSLIIPCYNEQEVLPIFYQEIEKVLLGMNFDYELLFINDGSEDATLEILRKLSQKDKQVFYLSFSRNFGKEAAMYAGICNARGDYIAVIDADLQDPPALLPEMLKILETGNFDSVAARRQSRIGEPIIRSWFAKRFYQIINKISDTNIVDGARDFRLMKRSMADAVISMTEYNRFSKGIYGWVGFQTYWLSYENAERAAGKTKWNFGDLFKYAVDGIINFSQVPLNLSSWLGVTMTFLSFVLMAVIILRKLLLGDSVEGWTSINCIILFVGGIQLFCMGIMGQYIAKIYMETKYRPHFIVSETNSVNAVKIK